MTVEQKAELFDEIINWLDNDDTLRVNRGTLISHGRFFYLIDDEEGENPFDNIEDALKALGYEI